MEKIEELKENYLKDADLMSSKSRFGYFSIPPSATAGHNMFENKKIIKDESGKVKTQQRNIFSGLTASGVLKKSYFKYQPSVFQGDPFNDPGKHQRGQRLKQMQKLAGKDIYKPSSLVKTPDAKPAYEHIAEKPIKKMVKDVIDANGKVKTEQRNVMASSAVNIQRQRLKQIKYIEDPYDNQIKKQRAEAKKSIQLRGQVVFRSSSPMKSQFYTSRKTYGVDENCKIKTQRKQKQTKGAEHDATFKPSCRKEIDTFSYPEYMPAGLKEQPKRNNSTDNNLRQKFKVHCPKQNAKPCPSISTMKSNILRSIR